jgi:hypothetical protein
MEYRKMAARNLSFIGLSNASSSKRRKGSLNHSHQSVEAVTLKDTRASTPTQDGSPTTAAVDFVDSNLKLNFMNMIDLKPHMKSLLDSYTEIIRLLMVSIRSSVFVHVDTLLLLEQFAR